MNSPKKLILAHNPVTACNFRCEYCYITQLGKYDTALPSFPYSAGEIRRALSKERMGGACFINTCGGGETLLTPETVDYVRELLLEGHYVEVVTNGSLTKRFEEIVETYPADCLARLIFKFSFHYAELLRLGLMDAFFANIERIRRAGCSFTVEMPACDSLAPLIPEIKRGCMENLGALCHLTIARDDRKKEIPIMTDYSLDEYKRIWDTFESDMFEFKYQTYYVKRKEFCYAGLWSFHLLLGTGMATKCYGQYRRYDIFQDIESPLRISPVGRNCKKAHCYNSHAHMTLGIIPELETPTYAQMRNRLSGDDSWIKPEVCAFLSGKLMDGNRLLSQREKQAANTRSRIDDAIGIAQYIGRKAIRR